MVPVRPTTMTDWQALREIRLQALRDAPYAFASTHAREAAFADDEWQGRATRDGSFLAFLPEVSPAGLGSGYLAAPDTVELNAYGASRSACRRMSRSACQSAISVARTRTMPHGRVGGVRQTTSFPAAARQPLL